jgi:hypothetical protein
MPNMGGVWRVTSIAPDGWIQCAPVDSTSETLVGLSPDGVVWFRKRDLIRESDNPEQGTLF